LTQIELAQSYLEKCELRMKVLEFLMDHRGWSDVVREAQELVELATKGILREIGVDPPKFHDVSSSILANRDRLPPDLDVDALTRGSMELRKDREPAFYGAPDLIPTLAYTEEDARTAIEYARIALDAARLIIGRGGADASG
jgi:HEPN domain-containing protein